MTADDSEQQWRRKLDEEDRRLKWTMLRATAYPMLVGAAILGASFWWQAHKAAVCEARRCSTGRAVLVSDACLCAELAR